MIVGEAAKGAKGTKHPFLSFTRTQESRELNHLWTSVFAGIDGLGDFQIT